MDVVTSPATSVATSSIAVTDLAKDFGTARRRLVHALAGVTLAVDPGEIYVLLGANGAGKSTLMRCLLGYLAPSRGATAILGGSSRDTSIRARVGYLPGDLRLPARSTVDDILRFRSILQRKAGRPSVDADDLYARLELPRDRRFGTLSKGNRQKVGLALALLAAPEVLVLDEPTSGLDPIMQESVLDLVRDRRDHGAAILLSTHILSEATRAADRVGVLSSGKLVVEAPLSTLLERARQSIVVTLEADAPGDVLAGVEGLHSCSREGRQLTVTIIGSAAETMRRLAPYGIRRVATQAHELDDMFTEASEGAA